jgi:hypothetical protein
MNIGNQKKGYNCSNNEDNFAGHIWDERDKQQFMGATACVVVTSFLPYCEKTGDWTALAWWIHDHVPAYANMVFFPNLAAFNITWRENPESQKSIYSYVENPHTGKHSGYLTHPTMENFNGLHTEAYQEFLQTLKQ